MAQPAGSHNPPIPVDEQPVLTQPEAQPASLPHQTAAGLSHQTAPAGVLPGDLPLPQLSPAVPDSLPPGPVPPGPVPPGPN